SHWFADLFRLRAHVRSSEVEEVLGSVAEVFGGIDSINNMLVDSDFTFACAKDSQEKEWPLVQSTVESYLGSSDRTLRQNAWNNFCDTHVNFAPTLAANLVTVCKKDSFIARTRKYSSSLDAALSAHNIPLSVYETTLETFKKNLPVWHRYWKVKAQALNLKKLSHWDIWAPISLDPPKVDYEQAVEWITSALAPLGSDYAEILKKGCLEERWVDVFPTKGKSSGAFSYGSRATKPFIMMSWAGDLSSLSTLTHELGHSMHSYHTWKNQSPAYCDYSIFVAEVASNFHQAMTRSWLFEHEKEPEFQIALIEEAMENFHRYFFIMPILALFEREIHERTDAGKGITASDLSSLMTSLFSLGYGDGVEIDPAREGSTWAQFGHLYSNFYVFQYATGISAAHALASPILAGDESAVARYREFLSSGSSVYPVDALKKAGIDMSGPQAMEKGFEVLSSLIDRLEKLIAER
ncbi:MAG TPA: M3 family oligoendopeptidase, partial [Treponemataceae bacterium]|nr:M3 family oligoendopeptidase [Treponemataceae bacterium]